MTTMPSPEQPPLLASEALRSLQNRPFVQGARFKEQQERARTFGAHDEIVEFGRKFVRRFQKLYIPMFAHCIMRTPEEQDALFVQGFSKLRGRDGAHVNGCAIDLIHGVRGWELARKEWDLVGHVGYEVAQQMGLKLQWGGEWHSPYDPAHWELLDWRDIGPPKS